MVLELITRWFTPAILIVGCLHLVVFGVLWWWARRDLKVLAHTLDEFTAGLHRRSRREWQPHLSDQIDAFVADIRDALSDPRQRSTVEQRIGILDERRSYLDSFRFETAWTVARSGIEAYPLLGVLGTIFALWLAMRGRSEGDEAAVTEIVNRFSLAIDSTFAGLAMAIVLMVVNSCLDTLFRRLLENRRHVREVIAEAKRALIVDAAGESQLVKSEAVGVERNV